jgi:2-oxoisovalerate dehydrogenase E1 component
LEPNNTKLLEWFRIWSSIRGCWWIALANKLKKNGNYCSFTGEGATPVKEIFMRLWILLQFGNYLYVCNRNNGYGLSTPTNEQYRCENLLKEKDTEWKVILLMEQYSRVYNLLSELKSLMKKIHVLFY